MDRTWELKHTGFIWIKGDIGIRSDKMAVDLQKSS